MLIFKTKNAMKTHLFISLFLVTIMLSSCDSHRRGTVKYNIKFTTQSVMQSKTNTSLDKVKSENITSERYTQFGNYITSITPYKFTALIWTIGYIDKLMERNSNSANMLQYIEQNADKLSWSDPSRIVDFSNNNVVSFNPVIYGRVNNDKQFEDDQIDFNYFYFIPRNFYQEIQLPSSYANVHLSMFNGVIAQNNVLKIGHVEMFKKVFPNAQVESNIYFIFGNTDSTFVVNRNAEFIPLSANCPIAEPGPSLVIRSNKYTKMIFNSPKLGETVVMNGTVSFDTRDIIQIYAGADNIPFTSDDIFVYAPKFWERITSKLEVN